MFYVLFPFSFFGAVVLRTGAVKSTSTPAQYRAILTIPVCYWVLLKDNYLYLEGYENSLEYSVSNFKAKDHLGPCLDSGHVWMGVLVLI
jgi:hypothetical protein